MSICVSEPKYFDITKYENKEILENDIKDYVKNKNFLSTINNEIKDWYNIPINSYYILVSFDKEYYTIGIEKCSFCGYLLKKLSNTDDFSLLFHSLETQRNTTIDIKDAKYSIYGINNIDIMISSIISYYQSFVKAKEKITYKINKVKNLIVEINKVKNIDLETMPYIELKSFSSADVSPEDNMFDTMINNLQIMLENYYKLNNLCSMDGKKNNIDFIKDIRNILNNTPEEEQEKQEEQEEQQ